MIITLPNWVESPGRGKLLYTRKHISWKLRNDLYIYGTVILDSLFIELISTRKGLIKLSLLLKGVLIWTWMSLITADFPLDWNSPCRGEGASHQEVSNRVRQREELKWASQLKSSNQQIFSRMSVADSPLIRQD